MLGKIPQSVIPPFRPSCITRKESEDLLIEGQGRVVKEFHARVLAGSKRLVAAGYFGILVDGNEGIPPIDQ